MQIYSKDWSFQFQSEFQKKLSFLCSNFLIQAFATLYYKLKTQIRNSHMKTHATVALIWAFMIAIATATLTADRNLILNLTNSARANVSVIPLVLDDSLSNAAQLHAQDMFDNNYFSHYSLDGRTPTDRAGEPCGENIAYNYNSDLPSLFTAWMNSPGHRANIENGTYARLGAGIHRENNYIYGVQMFGFALPDTPVPEGVNNDVADVVDEIYSHISGSSAVIDHTVEYYIQEWLDLGKPDGNSWPFQYLFSHGVCCSLSAYKMGTSLTNLAAVSGYNLPSGTKKLGAGVEINGLTVTIWIMAVL